jgi:hypothetical protein
MNKFVILTPLREFVPEQEQFCFSLVKEGVSRFSDFVVVIAYHVII